MEMRRLSEAFHVQARNYFKRVALGLTISSSRSDFIGDACGVVGGEAGRVAFGHF
jgi:hypothetical protein